MRPEADFRRDEVPPPEDLRDGEERLDALERDDLREPDDFLDPDFFDPDFRDRDDRLDPDERRDEDERFRPEDREEPEERFAPERFDARFFGGTLAPFFRASDSPIATACLRLLTFRPLPLFSVPRLRLRIALPTDFEAFRP